jgi:hypothetical protein
VLVGLLVFGDVQARHYAERQIAHIIETHEPGATATVRIRSFPFVGRLAVARQVQKVTANVRNVPVTTAVGNFTLDEVDLTMKGVKVDLGPLVAGSNGAVKSIRSGSVRAVISEAQLDKLVRVPLSLGTGSAHVTVAGVTVSATASVSNNQLHLAAGPLAVNVTLPAIPVLPCVAEVAIVPGKLVLGCAFNTVPAALLKAAGAG